jgi:hypothetical protein
MRIAKTTIDLQELAQNYYADSQVDNSSARAVSDADNQDDNTSERAGSVLVCG